MPHLTSNPVRQLSARHRSMSRRVLWTLATLSSAVAAQAQEGAPSLPIPAIPTADGADTTPSTPKAPSLQRVEILGGPRSDTDQRRQSTAAKIVVGRDEIERFGDSSVSDVLKRLPGVTLGGNPGRGGEIRMRGMGSGYTQVLVNGERIPPGFSIETLSPDQIERIEVLRAPTAEFGAQAIAGTINIVLREDVRRRLNNLSVTAGFQQGRLQPSAAWSRADKTDGLDYTLSANVWRQRRADDAQSLRVTENSSPGAAAPLVTETDTYGSRSRHEGFNLGGRLQWRLGAGETFSLSPFVLVHRGNSAGESSLQTSPTSSSRYDSAALETDSRFVLARSTAQWNTRPAIGGRLESRVGVSLSQWTSATPRQEYGGFGNPLPLPTQLTREQYDTTRARENNLSSSGKYTRSLSLDDSGSSDHQLAAGWDVNLGLRQERQHSTDTLASGPIDDDLAARILRTALWAQDEWQASKQWTLHAGLRWEAIATRSRWTDPSSGLAQQSTNRASVWSPLLHALWKPFDDSPDQLRASLTRSYKAPQTSQLVARRSISRAYPSSGPNEFSSPDRVGNPDLQPELATGLDLAYEHYLPGNGVVSASVFQRRIKNLIRSSVNPTPETVNWSNFARYVSRTINIDSAVTRGVEFDAKLKLNALLAQAPAVDLRGNLSVFQSEVTGIPGPDNRLDRQPDFSANLGADWKLKRWPLTLGGNLSLSPSYAVQQSVEQLVLTDRRQVLDVYGLYVVNPALQWRVSANNLFARNSSSSNQYLAGNLRETFTTREDSSTQWQLRMELKL